MTARDKRDMLPGTLDMLILKTLTVQSMHGYGIAQEILRLDQQFRGGPGGLATSTSSRL